MSGLPHIRWLFSQLFVKGVAGAFPKDLTILILVASGRRYPYLTFDESHVTESGTLRHDAHMFVLFHSGPAGDDGPRVIFSMCHVRPGNRRCASQVASRHLWRHSMTNGVATADTRRINLNLMLQCSEPRPLKLQTSFLSPEKTAPGLSTNDASEVSARATMDTSTADWQC